VQQSKREKRERTGFQTFMTSTTHS